jgi:hypothetical protein
MSKLNSAFKSLPIGPSMVLRLHECGSEEDQARLVYVLTICLDKKERWLCSGMKKPIELMRWALAGYEKWGLAEEFEPMRRLARCEAMGQLLESAQGRVNESLSPRVGHVRAMALIPPRFDHLFWGMLLGVGLMVAWGGVCFADGAWAWKGGLGVAGLWLSCLGFCAAMLKGSVYIWQDSSSSMAEGIKALGWGRSPRESAIARLSEMGGARSGESSCEPKPPPELARKARRGQLTPLEALEVSRVAKSAKAWRDDWNRVQERLASMGQDAILDSKQPGWALARLEEMELGYQVSKPAQGDAGHGRDHERDARRL